MGKAENAVQMDGEWSMEGIMDASITCTCQPKIQYDRLHERSEMKLSTRLV